MYVCGVTPYDTTHLGHARTFVVFDVLARLLGSGGVAVRYVQNVTDVDESILQRAARDGVDWRALGRREERAFLDDMDRLGWRRPDVMPHATREIPTMRGLIDQLIARGAAYRLEGSVYFSVARAPHYGELSRYSRAKMRRLLAEQDDARLDDPRRRDPLDFALWRRVPSGPAWPSRFGAGRPGWHLECSAMALRHLGDHIDVHGGGSDLVYPHHENEIAQSETATGTRPFVTFWLHAGPVRLGGRKMSKSDGNMVFVRTRASRLPRSPKGPRRRCDQNVRSSSRIWSANEASVRAFCASAASAPARSCAARSRTVISTMRMFSAMSAATARRSSAPKPPGARKRKPEPIAARATARTPGPRPPSPAATK